MSTMGPLYSVISIAPVHVIVVPITFARLCFFPKFTFSNLKMMAIMKVRAGRTLTVADAYVADVYFIPKTYKF